MRIWAGPLGKTSSSISRPLDAHSSLHPTVRRGDNPGFRPRGADGIEHSDGSLHCTLVGGLRSIAVPVLADGQKLRKLIEGRVEPRLATKSP